MSIHIMAKKHRAQKGISSGNNFSTYGVRRHHYYIGANGITRPEICPKSVGKEALKAAKTTSGLLSSRIHFPSKTCEDGTCAKYNWVKSFNPEEHAQSNYIHKIKVASSCNGKNKDAGKTICSSTPCTETYIGGGGKRKTRSYFHKEAHFGAISSSEYTNINLYKKNCLPTPPCKAPFPFIINQNGCNSYFKTPEEAIDAGYLPDDWMNCDTDVAFKSY